MMIRLSIILLLAGEVLCLSAEEFYVQNWRREDGLPDGQITAIEQTADGYLWIGTAKGLARFDGQHFKVFKAGETPGFTDSRISSLTIDCQGALWVGMLDGNVVRREAGIFQAMQPPVPLRRSGQDHIPDTWLWDRRLAMIEEVEGTSNSGAGHLAGCWAELTTDGTGAVWWHVSGLGIMRFQAGFWSIITVTNGLPGGSVRQLVCDHEGRIWIEAENRLHLFSGNSPGSESQAVALSGQWSVLAPARTGGLWVAAPGNSWLQEGGRLRRLAGREWRDELSLSPPLPRTANSVITCLLEDRSGRIWCGTAAGGVHFSNSQGGWEKLRPQTSFSQGFISRLFEDHQGNIWVGTVGDGLYRVMRQPVTMLQLPPPLQNAEINTTCVTRDGSVWIGTAGSGAVRHNGSNFAFYGKPEGLANQHVCALFEDSQTNLWAGTSGGVNGGRTWRRCGGPTVRHPCRS